MKRLDDQQAVKILKDIYWVGFADYEAGFANNPYLIIDNNEAVLIDPGPGHPFFRDLILGKIQSLIKPDQIKYIIAHHQDPDICGLIPFLESLVHPECTIIAHPRTAIFLPYYGLRNNILPVGDGDSLKLASGRTLQFVHLPYLHFAGTMGTYDKTTKTLFSSDLFAVFNKDWSLFASLEHKHLMKGFIDHYIASHEPVDYAYSKLKSMDIEHILPQHGGIIMEQVPEYLEILKEAEPGQLLKTLQHPPTDKDLESIIESAVQWLEFWTNEPVEAETFDDVINQAINFGPAAISLLTDSVARKSYELGVANPMTRKKVHSWDGMKTVRSDTLISSARNKLMKAQYSMQYGNEENVDVLLEKRLMARKAKLIIFFTDIRGFTGWSEELPPDEIVRTLNQQQEYIAGHIRAKGGRINKVMGDGIMAYFPESRASEAYDVAIDIQAGLGVHKLLPIGIGIDAGPVIIGDIGEETRLDYTLIGKPVNFASRMCNIANTGEICFTRDFYNYLPEQKQIAIQTHPSYKAKKTRLKEKDPWTQAIIINPYNK
ncbi:MAG: adenylate/guanylate cyclase domain-containing protein [Spirochaetia bacterium]